MNEHVNEGDVLENKLEQQYLGVLENLIGSKKHSLTEEDSVALIAIMKEFKRRNMTLNLFNDDLQQAFKQIDVLMAKNLSINKRLSQQTERNQELTKQLH